VSERLSSNNNIKKSIMTAAAVGGSVLALTGCYNQADNEAGSNRVKNCPEGYIQSADKPIQSPQQFNLDLIKAVNQLSAQLPRNSFGSARTDLRDLNKSQQALVDASMQVFYLNDNGFREKIDISDETKIDDASEQMCSINDRVYVSQRASQAIGAMESAGIDVSAVQKDIK
jgi:hypothetical protein